MIQLGRSPVVLGLLLTLAGAGTAHADEPIDLDDRVSEVTVYTDQAAVTRSARVTLGAGTHRLLFDALPSGADARTVQAGASGGRVQLVELVPEWEPPPDEEGQALLVRAAEIRADMQRLMERYQGLVEEANQLMALQRDVTRAEGEQGADLLNPATDPTVRTWAQTRLGRAAEQAEELRVAARALRRELEELVREQAPPSQAGRERVVVTVEVPRGGNVEVWSSVRVGGPRWVPAYDLQLDPDSGVARLQLTAQVAQATGEDWENADLRFSTAVPGRAADLPQLAAWYLQEQAPTVSYEEVAEAEERMAESSRDAAAPRRRTRRPAAAAGRAQSAPAPEPMMDRESFDDDADGAFYAELESLAQSYGTADGVLGGSGAGRGGGGMGGRGYNSAEQQAAGLLGALGNISVSSNVQTVLGPAPDGSRLVSAPQVVARTGSGPQPDWNRWRPSVQAAGFDFAYEAGGPVTLPGDGTVQRIPLDVFELPVGYEHRVNAVVEEAAFLTAVVEQNGRLPLLGGRTQVFDRGELLGVTEIRATAPGAEIEVALGPDPQVRVEREVTEEADRSGAVGGEKVDRAVALRVQNLRQGAINVVLTDRLPRSYQDGVRIREGEFSREPGDREENGLLEWSFEVAPGATEETTFDYQITHPRNTAIVEG